MTLTETQVQNAAEKVLARLPATDSGKVSTAIDWNNKQVVLRTVDPTDPLLLALTHTSLPDGFRVVIQKTKASPKDVDSLSVALGKVEATLPAPGSFAGVSANPDFSGLQIIVKGLSKLDSKTHADWQSVAEKYTAIYGLRVTISDQGYVKDLVGRSHGAATLSSLAARG